MTMPAGESLAYRSATDLLTAMRQRDLSPTELLDDVLASIRAQHDRLNAFTQILEEQARVQAAESERRILAGEARALEGLPLPIKDNVLIKDVPITDGSRMAPGFPAPLETELVARLRTAGAVFVGKTNLPEFGTISTTENERFGPTRNPWDLSRTAGGSSGGSAAAVAAGIVPAAHGNDGGGSLRIPASCCGLFSVKPSRGRIPRGPLPGNDPALLIVDGFLTRTVADNAFLLDVVAGSAIDDPIQVRAPERPFAAEVGADPGKLRIGWTAKPPIDIAVDPVCVAAVEDAAQLAEELGHTVEPVTPAWESATIVDDFFDLWAASVGAQMDFYVSLGADPSVAEPHNRALRERARGVDAARMFLVCAQLQLLARQGLATFASFDVLLMPTLALPPVPLGWHFRGWETDPMAAMNNATRFAPFTANANLSGQPVAALPLYWHDGLPIGVSAFGRPLGEGTLLRLSAQFEAARPWADRRPPQL
jgi:amidase